MLEVSWGVRENGKLVKIRAHTYICTLYTCCISVKVMCVSNPCVSTTVYTGPKCRQYLLSSYYVPDVCYASCLPWGARGPPLPALTHFALPVGGRQTPRESSVNLTLHQSSPPWRIGIEFWENFWQKNVAPMGRIQGGFMEEEIAERRVSKS